MTTWLFSTGTVYPWKKIAKSMNIAFFPLLDQLLEVGHFITAHEKIDMNNRPLLSGNSALSKKLLTGISVLGVRIQLKQGRINSVLFLYSSQRTEEFCGRLASTGYFCACIPYGQLTLGEMPCTCLWDIRLTLSRDGQCFQE